MKIVNLIILILLISSCSSRMEKKEYTLKDYESMSIFEYIKLTEDRPNIELKISIAALILSKEVFPDIEFAKYIEMIDDIAEKVNHYVQGKEDISFRIAAINTVLYRDYGFEFDKEDFQGRKLENHFLSSALDRRKAVCTALPLVYMVVAERLGYPIRAVSAPSHVFCRYVWSDKDTGKKQHINIEATGNGGETPDVCYIDDMQIPKLAYQNGVYLKTLDKREYVGVLLHGNGAYYLMRKDIKKAVKYLEQCVKLNHRNSFSHYVLGLCYKKLCNEAKNIKDNKDYYFKALRQDNIVTNLGIAPLLPENYWKQSFLDDGQQKEKNTVITKKDGIDYVEDIAFRNRVKQLEIKYYDYFK